MATLELKGGRKARVPDFETNPYWASSRENFEKLVDVYANRPESAGGLMRHSCAYLKRWLYEVTDGYENGAAAGTGLNPAYSTRRRLYMVFHGIARPVQCPNCGRPTRRRVMDVWQEREPFCCAGCASSFEESIAKGKSTKLKLYGDETFNNREKFYETLDSMPDEKFDEWRRKISETMSANHGVDFYMRSDEFREKSRKVLRERYGDGYSSFLQVPEVREKGCGTKEREHGDRHWSNSEQSRRTHKERTGYETVFQTPEFKEYVSERMPEINAKRRETTIRHFGRAFALPPKYKYGSETFDSKPEFAFWLWLRDSGADFKRNNFEDHLDYEYGGKRREYYPDFVVDGRFVEIKGDQFFRPDGTMYCPYRNPEWTDEEYEWHCGKYEAKRRCMVANGVRILRESEYSKYLDYAERAYGKEFFEKYRYDTGSQLGK